MSTQYYKLYAGLGNQLFQYAHAKHLEQSGARVRLILNRDFTKKSPIDLPEVFTLDNTLVCIPRTKTSLLAAKAWAKYMARAWDAGFYQEFRFADSLKNDETFDFKHKSVYQKCFLTALIKESTAVSIHIRGGDYLRKEEQAEYGNICTPLYYEHAIKEMKTRLSNPTFFVFTNDTAYAKTVLDAIPIVSGEKTRFMFVSDLLKKQAASFEQDGISLTDNIAYELFLQTRCKGNIIANSTFSWWGAFLNKTPQKTVISPNKWHNERPEAIEKLVPPESGWIRL